MQNLEKYCLQVVLHPSLKGFYYSKICSQLGSLSELPLAQALECLEFLNTLYPYSIDIAYYTALTLCRNEQYRDAWQLLTLSLKLPHVQSMDDAKPSTSRVCGQGRRLERELTDAEGVPNEQISPSKSPSQNAQCIKSHLKFSVLNTSENSRSFVGTDCNIPVSDPFNLAAVCTSIKGAESCPSTVTCVRDPRYRALHANVVNALVDRWHFPMLNDKRRNTAFKRAIGKAVEELGGAQLKIRDNQLQFPDPIDTECSRKIKRKNCKQCYATVYGSITKNSENKSKQKSKVTHSRTKGMGIHRLNCTEGKGSNVPTHDATSVATDKILNEAGAHEVTVLDIGCGTGLLSLYARQFGASKVWGCDSSEFMCEVAQGVVQLNAPTVTHLQQGGLGGQSETTERTQLEDDNGKSANGLGFKRLGCSVEKTSQREDGVNDELTEQKESEKRTHDFPKHLRKKKKRRSASKRMKELDDALEVINLNSKHITLEDTSSLNKRVQLVVTETLDAAVLGEHIADTLLDAWQRLLLPPSAPPRSTLSRGRCPVLQEPAAKVIGTELNNRKEGLCSSSGVAEQNVEAAEASTYFYTEQTEDDRIPESLAAGRYRIAAAETGFPSLNQTHIERSLSQNETCRYRENEVPKTSVTIIEQMDLLASQSKIYHNYPAGIPDEPRTRYREGRVIPGRVEAYVMLVQCEYIARYSKTLKRESNDHKAYSTGVNPTLDSKKTFYTTERLLNLPGGFTPLSKWFRVFDVDFNSPDDLKKHTDSSNDRYIGIQCNVSGRCDAAVLGFRLFVDEDNCIDTFPESNSCWESAVYPTRAQDYVAAGQYLTFKMSSNQVITIEMTLSQHLLEVLKCTGLCSDCRCRYREATPASDCYCTGSYREIPLDKYGIIKEGNSSSTEHCAKNGIKDIYFPSSSLRALNSSTYTDALTCAAGYIAHHHIRTKGLQHPFAVYDETPVPVAVLVLHRLLPNVTVTVSEDAAVAYLVGSGVAARCVRSAATVEIREAGKEVADTFDAVFMWPVTEVGVLHEDIEDKLQFCRDRVSSSGHVFPAFLNVFVTCLNSPQLLRQTRVHDDNTCGVRLSELINMVKTTHQLDVILDGLPHEQVTAVSCPFSVNFVTGKIANPECSSPNMKEILLLGDDSDKNSKSKCYSTDLETSFLKNPCKPGEGWDTKEGQHAIDLHRCGLLCTGRNIFEVDVQVRALTTSQIIGVAHWFGLCGLGSVGDQRVVHLAGEDPVNYFLNVDRFNELEPINVTVDSAEASTNSSGNNRRSYFHQTVDCLKSIFNTFYDAADRCSSGSHLSNSAIFDKVANIYSSAKSDDSNYIVNKSNTKNGDDVKAFASHLLSSSSSSSIPAPGTSENLSAIDGMGPSDYLSTVDECTLAVNVTDSKRNNNITDDVVPANFNYVLGKNITAVDGNLRNASVLTIGLESPTTQAVFMLDTPLTVTQGQRVTLDFVYRDGCFWVDAR